MPRDEIHGVNPGGIGKQVAPQAGSDLATERKCAPPIPDLRLPLPDRNVPAWLSFACGVVALLFAVIGYVTACDSPHWLARVLAFSPAGMEAGALLAVVAFLLGVFGAIESIWYPTAGGLPWALGGLATSGLALYTVLETFGELCSYWT
jgi:hypothetical protein